MSTSFTARLTARKWIQNGGHTAPLWACFNGTLQMVQISRHSEHCLLILNWIPELYFNIILFCKQLEGPSVLLTGSECESLSSLMLYKRFSSTSHCNIARHVKGLSILAVWDALHCVHFNDFEWLQTGCLFLPPLKQFSSPSWWRTELLILPLHYTNASGHLSLLLYLKGLWRQIKVWLNKNTVMSQ